MSLHGDMDQVQSFFIMVRPTRCPGVSFPHCEELMHSKHARGCASLQCEIVAHIGGGPRQEEALVMWKTRWDHEMALICKMAQA